MAEAAGSGERIRQLLAARALQGFMVVAGDPPTVMEANGGAADLFGGRELAGIDASRLGHSDEKPRLIRVYRSCLQEPGRVRSVSFTAMMPDGSTRDLLALAMGFDYGNGRAMAVGLLDQGRSWEERSLGNRDEALYRSLVENAFDAIYMLEGKHYVYVNPRFCEITGYSFDELTHPDFDYETLLTPETSRLIERRYTARAAGEDVPQGYTVAIRTRSGERALVDVSTVSLADEPGDVRVLGIMRDVTERQRARRELRESQRFAESIISNVPGMVFRCHNDRDWRMEYVSAGCLDLTGYQPDEIVDNSVMAYGDLILEEDAERVWKTVQNAVDSRDSSYGITYRIRNRSGSVRYVWEHASVVPGAFGDEPAIEGIVSDITEMRRTEERYAASKGRLEAIIRSMHDLLFVFDRSGNFIHFYAPDNSRLLMGPSEFLGEHYSDVLPSHLAEKLDAAFRIARGGEVTDFEYSLHLDDSESHYMARLSPLVEDGQFAGVISVSRDITSLVEAERERRRIQQELQKSHKLESMGVMAGGVAHDFNNLLEAIIGQTDLALAEGGFDDALKKRLKTIRKTATRASDLSDKMLAFSGRAGRNLVYADLSAILRSMEDYLRSSISADVRLAIEAPDDQLPVRGDPSQIEQVILNLALNGGEAVQSEDDPTVELRLDSVVMDSEELASTYVNDDLTPGTYARITVTDNGCGMDSETRARVFDPFFTTKFTGRGLGLASVLGIVRGHGGALSVLSSPGAGSRFSVLLPLATDYSGDLHAGSIARFHTDPEVVGRAVRRDATVLLVDDERIILDTSAELLEHLGYSVRKAASGRAALKIVRDDPGAVDCAILDVTMPGMDGYETLEALRRVSPGLPVIVSSGYARDEIMPRFLEAGVDAFLHKPYSLAEISDALGKAMEA